MAQSHPEWRYPAKLLVKKDPRDKNEKYRVYDDFSNIPIPIRQSETNNRD